MKTSEKGLSLIQDREGVKLVSYKDTGGVWTIGVGHTGPEVVKGMVATVEQVLSWLEQDVAIAEQAVNKVIVPLSQNQFDALVSFVFNVGVGAFNKSTLLRKLNAKDYTGASKEFARWKFDNGKEVAGLVNRRASETKQFLS